MFACALLFGGSGLRRVVVSSKPSGRRVIDEHVSKGEAEGSAKGQRHHVIPMQRSTYGYVGGHSQLLGDTDASQRTEGMHRSPVTPRSGRGKNYLISMLSPCHLIFVCFTGSCTLLLMLLPSAVAGGVSSIKL